MSSLKTLLFSVSLILLCSFGAQAQTPDMTPEEQIAYSKQDLQNFYTFVVNRELSRSDESIKITNNPLIVDLINNSVSDYDFLVKLQTNDDVSEAMIAYVKSEHTAYIKRNDPNVIRVGPPAEAEIR